MKNIIPFFLLLAFTTSYAQYGKKHAYQSPLSWSLNQTPNTFNIRSSPHPSFPSLSYGLRNTNLNEDGNLPKNFHTMFWIESPVAGKGLLHSSYSYDFQGRVLTSSLSYSFKKR